MQFRMGNDKRIIEDNYDRQLTCSLAMMIELSVCDCKSNCIFNRCLCHKNNFSCTDDMCKCNDCENISANDITIMTI